MKSSYGAVPKVSVSACARGIFDLLLTAINAKALGELLERDVRKSVTALNIMEAMAAKSTPKDTFV